MAMTLLWPHGLFLARVDRWGSASSKACWLLLGRLRGPGARSTAPSDVDVDSPTRPLTPQSMKVVALLSGGKDSCFNLLESLANGHEPIAVGGLLPTAGVGRSSSSS